MYSNQNVNKKSKKPTQYLHIFNNLASNVYDGCLKGRVRSYYDPYRQVSNEIRAQGYGKKITLKPSDESLPEISLEILSLFTMNQNANLQFVAETNQGLKPLCNKIAATNLAEKKETRYDNMRNVRKGTAEAIRKQITRQTSAGLIYKKYTNEVLIHEEGTRYIPYLSVEKLIFDLHKIAEAMFSSYNRNTTNSVQRMLTNCRNILGELTFTVDRRDEDGNVIGKVRYSGLIRLRDIASELIKRSVKVRPSKRIRAKLNKAVAAVKKKAANLRKKGFIFEKKKSNYRELLIDSLSKPRNFDKIFTDLFKRFELVNSATLYSESFADVKERHDNFFLWVQNSRNIALSIRKTMADFRNRDDSEKTFQQY